MYAARNAMQRVTENELRARAQISQKEAMKKRITFDQTITLNDMSSNASKYTCNLVHVLLMFNTHNKYHFNTRGIAWRKKPRSTFSLDYKHCTEKKPRYVFQVPKWLKKLHHEVNSKSKWGKKINGSSQEHCFIYKAINQLGIWGFLKLGHYDTVFKKAK